MRSSAFGGTCPSQRYSGTTRIGMSGANMYGAHLLELHWTRLEQEYAWVAKDWWWTLSHRQAYQKGDRATKGIEDGASGKQGPEASY